MSSVLLPFLLNILVPKYYLNTVCSHLWILKERLCSFQAVTMHFVFSQQQSKAIWLEVPIALIFYLPGKLSLGGGWNESYAPRFESDQTNITQHIRSCYLVLYPRVCIQKCPHLTGRSVVVVCFCEHLTNYKQMIYFH